MGTNSAEIGWGEDSWRLLEMGINLELRVGDGDENIAHVTL